MLRCFAVTVSMTLLSACGAVPERDRASAAGEADFSSLPDAVPQVEPRSRHGNPHSYVVHGKRYFTLPTARGFVERGVASWYGKKFHGRPTSSREVYDMYKMTAAHKTLPLPTYVSVRDLSTGREIVVRVNDRGPFLKNRIIDLSYAAAAKLGIADKGTGFVEVRALVPGSATLQPDTAWRDRSSEIFIQAGAFQMAANAEKLRSAIADVSRMPVRVLRTSHDGRTLYRVRLGPVPGVAEADLIVDTLGTLGFERPQIVVE